MQDIKPIHIKEFYTTKQNLSKSALSKIKVCLNGIFEAAINNDLCFKNPSSGVAFSSSAKKHIKKVYTDQEIELVEKQAKNNLPEVIILLETGLRRGELLGLKWQDIDFKEKTLTVNRSIAYTQDYGYEVRPPKWNSYRTNPLSIKALSAFLSIKHTTTDYVFPLNKKQNPLSDWDYRLKNFMDTLPPEIPRLTSHELRHTYGTHLRRKGVDIYSIQKLMGHKDIRMTTEIYVHNEIDSLGAALEIIQN